MEMKANPGKSDRPVDSHKEWAQTIREMVSRDVHLDLQVASPPLRRSETRANDPADTPRPVPRTLPTARPPPAASTPSLAPNTIGM